MDFTLWCLIISTLICIFYFKKINSNAEYIILGILVFSLGIELTAFYIIDKQNTWFYNLLPLITMAASFIVISTFAKDKPTKRIGIILSLIFFILGLINYKYIQGPTILNTFTIIPSHLVLALYSYIILRKNILGDMKITPIGLGFLVANLIYFALSSTVLSALPLTNEIDMKISFELFKINQIAYCLWCISITVGFIWTKK